MSRNGQGQYSPPPGSWNPAVDGQAATPGDWNTLRDDISSALTQSVSKDGQTQMTGALRMGGNKIEQVGAPTGPGEVLRWQQIQKGADIASASTLNIPTEGALFAVTGTTTITGLSSSFVGRQVVLQFDDALTITDSISLILPSGDITTKAGDMLVFVNTEPGVWQLLSAAGAGGSAGGFRNKLINGDGKIQRYGYTSGTPTTAANQYVIDRWRVVTLGEALILVLASGILTMTVPSGGIGQVIEGSSIEGGVYVVSWQGTATCTINGTAVANGGSFILPPDTNVDVIFKAGTLIQAQVELGATASAFDLRPRGIEEIMCRRYLPSFDYNGQGWVVTGSLITATSLRAYGQPIVAPRVPPTGVKIVGALSNLSGVCPSGGTSSITAISLSLPGQAIAEIEATTAGSMAAGTVVGVMAGILATTGTGSILLTGCEL